MAEFKIRRGISGDLFLSDDRINPLVKLEEQCWYLCTDTANLYLCIKGEDNTLTLKPFNDVIKVTNVEIDFEGNLVVKYSNGTTKVFECGINSENPDIEHPDTGTTAIKIGDTTYSPDNGVVELPEFITEDALENKNYAAKTDLFGLASEKYVDDKIAAIEVGQLPASFVLYGGDANPTDD